MRRRPVVVVGGGVTGCAILWELARRGVSGLLVEAEPDVCEGTSKANSAIVHTGFDSKPGTLESQLLRRSAELWPEVIRELAVPFLPVGALMLARTAEEAGRLHTDIAANASRLGVRTDLLDAATARDLAPYLAPDVTAALSIPDEAVIDPFWLTRAYAEAAVAGGAELRLGRSVSGLLARPEAVIVRLDDGTEIEAEQVIDAAGLRADEVARLVGDESFSIRPRKGQFLVSEETFGVDRIVLPIPGPMGKGMLVTPIVFGGLLLGPTAVDQEDKADRSTDPAARERILGACRALVPAVGEMAPIRQFAGLRHVSSTGDFVVAPSPVSDRLFIAAGIRSTGISASPAVAERVVAEVAARRRWTLRNDALRLAPPPTAFPDEPGEVVCLCRSVSRAEIEAACRRPTAPRTLDAVKRRGGAMFGDCQGNLCALDVARIVAAERGMPVGAIEKHARGSWLWLERTDGDAQGAAGVGATDAIELDSRRLAKATAQRWDVVVVGGGRAGRSAAEGLAAGGLRVLVVERNGPSGRDGRGFGWLTGVTAVGLAPGGGDADRWTVELQSAAGSGLAVGRAVVLATGAYVEPREHRSIAGPRPAGVMTADLATRLLDAGLLPGMAVAVVGDGPIAQVLAERLAAAGARVARMATPPLELRGDAHLEAIRSDLGWQRADALVLADRLLPQAMLLRSLGLVDGRPGIAAATDGQGRLPLDGLWAAGCCVAPDETHVACATGGRSVAAVILAALGGSGGGVAAGSAATGVVRP
jgi:glycerol-3-phosphate dehydrogenase